MYTIPCQEKGPQSVAYLNDKDGQQNLVGEGGRSPLHCGKEAVVFMKKRGGRKPTRRAKRASPPSSFRKRVMCTMSLIGKGKMSNALSACGLPSGS